MYSILSFRITKEQYDYLITTVLKSKLLYVYNGIKMKSTGELKDLYAFTGTKEEYQDLLNRCKHLDEDLMGNSDYRERFDYAQRYNSGLTYKRIYY